ncbi:hypothetical protein [Bradyrhizobium sp. USDA 377]
MTIPAFWARFLVFVSLAKAAIAGAGVAVAVLGALDIAFAATAREFLDQVRPHFLDFAAIGGGLLGVVVRTVLAR